MQGGRQQHPRATLPFRPPTLECFTMVPKRNTPTTSRRRRIYSEYPATQKKICTSCTKYSISWRIAPDSSYTSRAASRRKTPDRCTLQLVCVNLSCFPFSQKHKRTRPCLSSSATAQFPGGFEKHATSSSRATNNAYYLVVVQTNCDPHPEQGERSSDASNATSRRLP